MLLAIGGILLPVNTLAVISVVAYGVLFVGLCFSSIAVVLGVRSHLMQLLSTD